MVIACSALAIALVAISGPAELGDIGAANLVAASLHLAVFGIFFGALALASGAATGRRSFAWGVVAIVAIGGFLANNLAPMVDELAWLRDLSPFHFYSGGSPLRHGVQVIDVAVLLLASALLVTIGGLRFDRRDVAV
jgi:ABC-2 type transport system permease protein